MYVNTFVSYYICKVVPSEVYLYTYLYLYLYSCELAVIANVAEHVFLYKLDMKTTYFRYFCYLFKFFSLSLVTIT